MKKEYRIKETTHPQRRFVVEERTVGVKKLIGSGTRDTLWRPVMIDDLDIEGNHCERENYHNDIESAKKFMKSLKEPKIKYHYE